MIKPAALIAGVAALALTLTQPGRVEAAPAAAAAETAITAPGPQGALAGTMLRAPKAKAPVALIIPGSGPTDRHGNNPLGVAAATYRLLAEGLAAQGITTVRIDKRGMFGSAGAVPDANAVTIPDYVTDTAAWVEAIRKTTGASCVWLIGHSEGGLVALAAAQQGKDLCGVVLAAAPGRPLGEVLKSQLRANPANAALIAPAEAAIDQLAAGQRVDADSLPAPLRPLFTPALQGFLASAFPLDPARLAGQVRAPLMIVQGGRDLQVPMADAERLKAANPSARLLVLPDANHVLKSVKSDNPADNLAAYRAADLPLADGVVAGIASFITAPHVSR